MSLKDSALAVLQRNHKYNKGATSDKKIMQLDAHLQANKVASDKLLIAVNGACKGFAITPDQFIALTTKEDHEFILSGGLPIKVLRAYAKSFANGIQTGRITFHPKFNHGIPSSEATI